jgi:hypothetical protein
MYNNPANLAEADLNADIPAQERGADPARAEARWNSW